MARAQSVRAGCARTAVGARPVGEGPGRDSHDVKSGGPAAEAGVATGDIIVAINGEATTGPNASREVVDDMAIVKPDTEVIVKVMRDGKAKSSR